MNVLIVDDSAVMRAMLQKVLRLIGMEMGTIHQAGNGQAALSVLAEQAVDLVLLDLSMPIMRGDEVLERLRQDPATAALPVLVISSEQAPSRIEQVRAWGAEFLAKPFTPEALRAAVLRLTGAGDEPSAGPVAAGRSDFDF
jgi:two-component system chemotaxis response regulator CheY